MILLMIPESMRFKHFEVRSRPVLCNVSLSVARCGCLEKYRLLFVHRKCCEINAIVSKEVSHRRCSGRADFVT